MNCPELRERLTDYAEGVIDGSVCIEIERHLAECATCRELREELEQVADLCRRSRHPRLPDHVRRRILDLLNPPRG